MPGAAPRREGRGLGAWPHCPWPWLQSEAAWRAAAQPPDPDPARTRASAEGLAPPAGKDRGRSARQQRGRGAREMGSRLSTHAGGPRALTPRSPDGCRMDGKAPMFSGFWWKPEGPDPMCERHTRVRQADEADICATLGTAGPVALSRCSPAPFQPKSSQLCGSHTVFLGLLGCFLNQFEA